MFARTFTRWLSSLLFAPRQPKKLERNRRRVCEINALEPETADLSDGQLRRGTEDFRTRLARGAALDELLVPAFAAAREAARRSLGMRHFDVQLMGGVVLHEGRIAEMKTGEGKTLTATLAAYLNALAGRGVHVVTANDYLARRDADRMAPVYEALGLKVGAIQAGMADAERRRAYARDVTYGTHQELSFDYLRDNMKSELSQRVQRGLPYAIVDEADVILIDDARAPLLIAGPSDDSTGGERRNQTLAAITLQNYFRKYDKLAGMTSTAAAVAAELDEVYNLEVSAIPSHRPIRRSDHADRVYRTKGEKWHAAVEEIRDCRERGQPVLVGTISIEESKALSERLERAGIPHVTLSGERHRRDAARVAQAGRKGAVTIDTYMAGRGTDVALGGDPVALSRAEVDPEQEPERYRRTLAHFRELCAREREEVTAAGGLHVLGTERHESRRIDQQLRERSGRQGDPGSSRFFLSLEDDLIRVFGSVDRIRRLIDSLEVQQGQTITNKKVQRGIERLQGQVEARHREIRKHLLRYDVVIDAQREELYALRREVLEGRRGRDFVRRVSAERLDATVAACCPAGAERSLEELAAEISSIFDVDLGTSGIDLEQPTVDELRDEIWHAIRTKYRQKEATYGEPALRYAEQSLMVEALDRAWKRHLLALDDLKEEVNGLKDPFPEYQRRSEELFGQMKIRFEDSMLRDLYRAGSRS